MVKNIFEVDNKEKMRILNLHESATKNQYLVEQNTSGYIDMSHPCNSNVNWGSIGFNVRKSYINNQDGFEEWKKTQSEQTRRIIDDAFSNILKDEQSFQIDYDDPNCIKIGQHFCENRDIFDSWNDYVKRTPRIKPIQYKTY